MAFIRSISGVRATLGDDMLPWRITEYAAAFSALLPEGDIVVGRDGRPSGEWIEHLVCGTLSACGRNVVRLGIVPTPTVQLFAERSGTAGGIAITASHNPEQWNGLKFLNGQGVFLDADENRALWDILDTGAFRFVHTQRGGSITTAETPISTHIASILALPAFAEHTGITGAIRKRRFRVVVDAVNCSGSTAIPELLQHFGCDIIPLYCDNSGVFPHTPEPLPENLSSLAQAVAEHKADIGLAVDPDADRLVLIDETGTPIGEENTIVIAVLAVLSNAALFGITGTPSVAVNLSTTRAVEDVAAQFGAVVHRTPVGEINVVKAMLEHGSAIGGEGSGGVILPSSHAGRDSLVGTALLLTALAQHDSSLSSLVATLPQYTIVKRKKEFQGETAHLFDAVERSHSSAEHSRADGLKLSFERSWVHLRASNTEPIVRIIAEAPTRQQAEELAEAFMHTIP